MSSKKKNKVNGVTIGDKVKLESDLQLNGFMTRQLKNTTQLSQMAGYETQISELRGIIELPLNESVNLRRIAYQIPKTVLLFGAHGTGKTMAMKALMNEYCHQMSCVYVKCSDLLSKSVDNTLFKLNALFAKAIDTSPALLFLDNVDILCGVRKTSVDYDKRLLSELITLLEDLPTDKHVVVIAATNKVDSIDVSLRTPGRLDTEIEFHVPSPTDRFAILRKHLSISNCDVSDEQLLLVAESGHSFTGSDLALVCRKATKLALESKRDVITELDLKRAIKMVRPSAMKEISLEVPRVYWNEIAGMEEVKERLTQSVVWPLKNAEVFLRMGIKPPRGVLMYGPPGCCKTMIGKALATESGLNFIAIKGPELFNKWVGESERAVREVFRRARSAAPSILFFDEIDALAAERGGGPKGGGQCSVGDRVLTQILTEIDGIESLNGVVIVAATNRPDLIDKALLRPGRLDSIVYVPLPDYNTRLEIFKIHSRLMPLEFTQNYDEALSFLAEKTDGYSGAEISFVCQEAALLALKNDLNCTNVCLDNFLDAIVSVRPRTTQEMIMFYESYSLNSYDNAAKWTNKSFIETCETTNVLKSEDRKPILKKSNLYLNKSNIFSSIDKPRVNKMIGIKGMSAMAIILGSVVFLHYVFKK